MRFEKRIEKLEEIASIVNNEAKNNAELSDEKFLIDQIKNPYISMNLA